ncbi:hypothetical protein LUZ62_062311 [Rhynchospora pubera]|uniref:Protein NO VEIN C-terminal domain-containing protein n=1 Tax=Rhynchospora pubera TaxID=906938 RepID=A0AAV8ECI3_9POAL|nr:hypothetical protein LUZ62_062311 [Rhynchospora pubera]
MRRRKYARDQGGNPSTSSAAESTSNYAAPADSNSTYAAAAALAENFLANISQNMPLNLLLPFQNPNSNLTYPPNPALLLQNPAFLPNPNLNPNPTPVLPNPNSMPNPNGSSSQSLKWLLEKAIDLTKQGHEELLSAGESVTGYKVARYVLASLGSDSWDSLGIQMKDVAPLQQIFQIEGRVSDFVHCFVMTRGIVTLYELEVEICKNEGVNQFENLMLGPFLRHPVVTRYFSLPPDRQMPVKITTGDVITFLGDILNEPNRSVVMLDELLTYIAKKKKVDRAEKLGVHIKDLGAIVRYIREARRGEQMIFMEVTEKFHDTNTEGKSSGTKKRPSKGESVGYSESTKKFSGSSLEAQKRERPGKRERKLTNKEDVDSSKEINRFGSEKEKLDRRFSHISSTVKTFQGKHTRFISSDEGSDADSSDEEENNNVVNVDLNTKSTCPYPSTTEELARLRLHSDPKHKSGKSKGNGTGKKERKKKAIEAEKDAPSMKSSKRRRLLATDSSQHFILCREDLERFIAIWKEPCRVRSISEVVELMQTIYNLENKDRKRMKWLFSIFPCIGLLNVAVNAIRNGSFESLYDTMQALDENEGPGASAEPSDVLIEVGSSNKAKEVTEIQAASKIGFCIEEIIRKITNYFEANNSGVQNETLSVKYLLDCAAWVSSQFSVDEFTALGHGDLLAFLQQHILLLPPKIRSIFSGQVDNSCFSLISMHERQLGLLLSQEFVKSKNDILIVLRKQFPTMSFHMSGNDLEKIKCTENPSGVLFSQTLLLQHTYRDGQNSELSLVSSSEALKCLLKAPFLSDLMSWSHWEHAYAPSLGSFFDWYLSQGCLGDLVCIATRDGKFIRVEPSATADQFLEAFIQLSSFWAAVKLLSLLYLYSGSSSMPVSLLKLYAERATGILVRDSDDLAQANTSASQAIADTDSKVHVVARFILDCLGYLPSEFWPFAANILLSGLQTVTNDVCTTLLSECSTSRQRFILHDIGLSLGFVEWVEDYRHFILTGGVGCKEDPSLFEKNTYSNSKRILSVVSKAPAVKFGVVSGSGDHNVRDPNDNAAFTNEVAADELPNTDDKAHVEASTIIETIRREEFGLDSNLNVTESGLLRKQHARLGRALHCLSQELYSQDSHLLLELVQNADDNIYPQSVEPTLVFILQETGIIVLNNECGFTAQNIKALCDVGNSTKKGSNAGYIGNKGIGFKSVFRVTDAPEIHSNGFHIKFDITEGQIGFVLPTVVPPRDINKFSCLLPAENGETRDFSQWNTCIVLPFRKNSDTGQTDVLVLSMFADLHPSLLLFLHRIQCIKFKSMIDGTYRSMVKQYLGHGIVRISDGSDKMSWLVVSKKLSGGMVRPDVQTTEIAMAFTLEEVNLGDYRPSLIHQPVFAFLPVRNYGLKFILQGDFALPTSREEVDGNNAWNQWLLSEYPSLFLSALGSFCSLPCFRDHPGKAVGAFMSFVPLVGEVHGFFAHLPHMIIAKLRTACCMILDKPGPSQMVPPFRVLRGWSEQVRLLFSDVLLEKSLGLGYLSRDVELSDPLARALGIRDNGPTVLYDAMSALFNNKDIPEDLLGMDWLSAWLVTLHSALLAHSTMRHFDDPGLEGDILDGLRKIPFIPLSDGSRCSVSEGHIWLPCDVSGVGFEDQYGVKEFPLLYASLHTVDPLLLTALSSNKYLAHEGRADDLTEMLLKIGVRKLSAHEIIKSHILPALSESTIGSDLKKELMVEYFAYILLHFQSACAICQSQKAEIILELRNKPVLLTNLGHVTLTNTPVHFGKEYGGTVDMKRFITMDFSWYEVDTAYLAHPSTRFLPNGSLKWRDFLKELGVTDFILVTQTQRILSDSSSVVTDWVSMELVRILSVLSTKKNRSGSIYLLEVLDKIWDENYSDKVFMGDEKSSAQSSFVKSLHEVKWIASSADENLHYPRNIFYDCADVRSLLGANVPYSLPQITSKSLLKEIGFKTEVSRGEALSVLTSWAETHLPFKASVDQMSRLYNYISEGIANSLLSLNQNFLGSTFIFTPFQGSLSSDVSLGKMLSAKEVYWLDPTGCFEMTKELVLASKSKRCPCKMLAAVYPGLRDFFVTRCGVPDVPPFTKYVDILLDLSTVASPTKASHLVAHVIMKWVNDIESKTARYDDILKLKELLHKVEYKILPTIRGKWVSLHASFGLTCWVDDDKLVQHFENVSAVNFLQLSQLESDTNGKIASFMKSLGIQAISKVVSREVVHYDLVNDVQKVCLVNWALPYVQRYMYKTHLLKYVSFKELERDKLSQLKVIVASKLYYKYSINQLKSTSQDLFEASAILKDNILYLTPTADSHTMYLELSRLFFDGSPDLQFANFLHMITTMAESGSSNEQIDFFLINSQNISKVPAEDPLWVLSPKINPIMNPLPPACHYNTQTKTGLRLNWPIPAINEIIPLSPENNDQAKDVIIPIEVEADWITEKDLASTSASKQLLSNEPGVSSSPDVQAFSPRTNVSDASANQLVSTSTVSTTHATIKNQVVVPADVDRNQFQRKNQENVQNLRTGRLGEMVAYKYFSEQLGPNRVRWVNELSETGLPYDLVINWDQEESKEYVEVKATLYSRKDWFTISMREWQFACEKGDAFTIAHVILMGSGKASVIVLKNLYRLILQHTLRLGVFMSGLHRDSLAEAEGEGEV